MSALGIRLKTFGAAALARAVAASATWMISARERKVYFGSVRRPLEQRLYTSDVPKLRWPIVRISASIRAISRSPSSCTAFGSRSSVVKLRMAAR